MKVKNTKKASAMSWLDWTFGVKIHVIIGENIQESLKYLNEVVGLTPEISIPDSADAVCIDFQHKGAYNVVMILHDGNSFGTIAHEALHAVNYIYKHYGVRADERNDEHAAYFLGRLVDSVGELVMKRSKLKK